MTIYDFEIKDNHGNKVSMESFKGQVVLIVNTASKCGFTPQLGPLQKLYEDYREKGFVILAFPSNQFAGQEPESDAQIESFYQNTYQVSFPIMAKADVNGKSALPLYDFLRRQKGGIFGRKIRWNFTKFLIGRDGRVTKRYAPSREPDQLRQDIEMLLME